MFECQLVMESDEESSYSESQNYDFEKILANCLYQEDYVNNREWSSSEVQYKDDKNFNGFCGTKLSDGLSEAKKSKERKSCK